MLSTIFHILVPIFLYYIGLIKCYSRETKTIFTLSLVYALAVDVHQR